MTLQLRLSLERTLRYDHGGFISSECNADALAVLDRWSAEGRGALALVGPAGSGKTHLAQAWAAACGARRISPGETPPVAGPVVVEDADRSEHGEALFHLLNQSVRPGAQVLLTGRLRPSAWRAGVPDLRSRLNALTVAELGEPDDAVLTAMLSRQFERRHIRPPADLLAYLVRRIERSASAAEAVAAALDEASHGEHKPVSRSLARQILKDEGEETR